MIQESVIEFKLPALGENIEQGDLVRLMIAPGATVSEGQTVMELETDKAVVEVPSSVSGKVKEILVKEGEKIKVGQAIFTVDNHAGAAVAAAAPGGSAPQGSSSRDSAPQGSIVPPPQRPSGDPTAAVKVPAAPTPPEQSQPAP
ncbi:MAG: biotin/lipoyl-containing protein, partial [Candidatus Sulfotelmatobacter sp.]